MGLPMLPGETAEEYAARIKREGGGGASGQPTEQTVYVQTPVSQGGFGEPPTVVGYAGAAPKEKTTGTDVIPSDSTADKGYTVANILDLMSIGRFDNEQAKAELIRLGYDETEADNLLLLGQKGAAKNPEISLSYLLEAQKNGVLSEEQVRQRLISTGYTEEDANILIQTAIAGNKKDADPTAGMSSEAADWKLFDEGMLSATEVATRLAKRGYDSKSITEQVSLHQKLDARADQEDAQRAADRAEAKARQAESDARYAQQEKQSKISQANSMARNAEGRPVVQQVQGPQNQRPQARQMLDDFRSGFIRNLRENGSGLSMPQKQWALDNMDTFLPNFLGATDGAAFTLGATEIANAYEGSRNTQRSSKSGTGLIQTRSL